MPKSKGTGSSTPKLNSMDSTKESALNPVADVGEAAGVFTRSRARRLSITVADHVSPPKKSRRSSISKKESSTQVTKDKSACPKIDIINEVIEISKSTPSPKKRNSQKANESELAGKLVEIEEKELGSTKKVKSSRKSLEDDVQESVITEVKSSKRDKSRNRKSTLMEVIQENATVDEADSTIYLEPSKINGISSKVSEIFNSAVVLNEEKSSISVENSCTKVTPKTNPSNFIDEPETTSQKGSAKLSSKKMTKTERSSTIAKLDDTPLQVSKKSKNSAKKIDSEIVIEKLPKAVESPSINDLDDTPLKASKKSKHSAKKTDVEIGIEKTPKAVESPSIDNPDDTPLKVSKKSKHSAKKTVVEIAIEKTPKAVESPSIDNCDDTPLKVSKKSKHSAKKTEVEIAIEKTPKAVESPSIDNRDDTPLKVSKKSKHSAKKTDVEIAIEKTPKAVDSPLIIDNLDDTPLKVSKKSKHSTKKTDVEIAIEKTPKAVDSPLIIDNLADTPLKVTKKSKHSVKKTDVEIAIEKTPKAVDSPLIIDNLDDTLLKVSKKSKHSAKKTDVEIAVEKTPKVVDLPPIDNLEDTSLKISTKSKHSVKKPDVEIAIEETPKAVESPSIDNIDDNPLKVSKKSKHSAKKSLENESEIPAKAELPLTEEMIRTPQPIFKATAALEKLSATKSISKNETTPKKIESPTIEMLGKTLVPVLKKPASPVKVLAKKTVIEDDTDSDEDSDAESRKEIMRSAEKRIIRNLSTSESESRNHVKVLQLPVVDVHAGEETESSSDSDSAPEDVTFDASRQSALELLKQTVDSIKRDKQKKKEKRKERLEVWRQRKEENLIRLKESKANRDDASCSSSEESLHERNGMLKSSGTKTYFDEEPAKPNLKRLPADIVNSLPNHFPKVPKLSLPLDRDLGQQETNNLGQKRKAGVFGKKRAKNGNPTVSNLKKDVDFRQLPGSKTTTFGVVSLNEPTLTSVAQKAANFKQNLLYGKRICRVPASTLITNRKKLEVNMK